MPLPGSNTGGLKLEPYREEATTQMAIHLLTPMHRRCLAKWAHRSIGLAQRCGESCGPFLQRLATPTGHVLEDPAPLGTLATAAAGAFSP